MEGSTLLRYKLCSCFTSFPIAFGASGSVFQASALNTGAGSSSPGTSITQLAFTYHTPCHCEYRTLGINGHPNLLAQGTVNIMKCVRGNELDCKRLLQFICYSSSSGSISAYPFKACSHIAKRMFWVMGSMSELGLGL
ncbi:hypothetical protein BKA82DRAFT_239038 [Pisolithus tinctorius]|uniref:Uncharacterized protein n=1 Tax=Pisolithus tinctorius Marx 270 TaxID=870435 RepID=A0A0C3NML3_PISTI|nr:hypothetical protein BKA82DRAFT_239038 [Pisolithus tinctorius]KIN96588.1 hypothetical protein M404DRAFT_239038 [Pisolithus tinctorius Marx 270]